MPLLFLERMEEKNANIARSKKPDGQSTDSIRDF